MESTNNETPAKRRRVDDRERTQIPHETMLEVLLWLDRFDLDGKQITARRLRSLVENEQMPLRTVHRVCYHGELHGCRSDTVHSTCSSLGIFLGEDGPADIHLRIETEADAEKAASYLSSCFVRHFDVREHRDALPANAIIAAPGLIRELAFTNCNFGHGAEDPLGETLSGSTFQCLAIYSPIPVWQIDDELLARLRLCGCNEIIVYPDDAEPNDWDEKFPLSEEGILSYCFTLDHDLPLPQKRALRVTWTTITPAFFKKLVEASRSSQLTCDVELHLDHLRFDVGNLDVGLLPSRGYEYSRYEHADVHTVRYNIDDHGNGIRLLIHFESEHEEKWNATIRHGKKDQEKFFEGTLDEEEEEYSQERIEYEPEREDPDSDFFVPDDNWI